jgi:hypothetical protein
MSSDARATLFSVLTTNQKGLVAEAAVMFECAKLGVPVLRPLDDQRYDLAIDLGTQIVRVQCKWGRARRRRHWFERGRAVGRATA